MDGGARLIDMNFKNYMFQTLQKCHQTKLTTYTVFFNVAVFVIFVVSFGLVLFFCYKGKVSSREMYDKMLKDQEYVLSKIRYYQNARLSESAGMITNIPFSYAPETVDYLYPSPGW